MLYIHCTGKLAKVAGIVLEPRPGQSDLLRIDLWYANWIGFTDTENAVLFTNSGCLYTFLMPVPRGSLRFFAVIAQFRAKLHEALLSFGASKACVEHVSASHAQYVTCKTASRSVLGSMNEMAFSVDAYMNWEAADNQIPSVTDIEEKLNQIPLSAIGYNFPIERFRELITTLPQS